MHSPENYWALSPSQGWIKSVLSLDISKVGCRARTPITSTPLLFQSKSSLNFGKYAKSALLNHILNTGVHNSRMSCEERS